MTADQARELTDKHTKVKIDFTINDVYRIIKERCKIGGNQVTVDGEIGEQTFHKLVMNGFQVHKVFKPREKYPCGRCYLVSWSSS